LPLPYKTALIVGTGPGISASLARALVAQGVRVAIASRHPERLEGLARSIGGQAFGVDVVDAASVERLFAEVEVAFGVPDVVVFNPSARLRGPIAELDAEAVRRAVEVSTHGGFLVVQQAARRLEPLGCGAILITGATASVKGFPLSAPFAIGKFGLRGLAQSAARELAPKGIHVAHFVIDGSVRRADDPEDRTLDPDAIAQTYLAVLAQPRSAWTWEVELRPWVEQF